MACMWGLLYNEDIDVEVKGAEPVVVKTEPINVADFIRGECQAQEVIEVYRGMVDVVNPGGKIKVIDTDKIILDNKEYMVENIKKDIVPIEIYAR